MRRYATRMLGVMLGLVMSSLVSTADIDPSLFKKMAYHSVAILGTFLYIDGGELSTYVNGKTNNSFPSIAINETMSISLSTKWTNSTITFTTEGHGIAPLVNAPVLWSDNQGSRLFRWGGEGSYGSTNPGGSVNLWVFDADNTGGGSWNPQPWPSDRATYNALLSAAMAGGIACGGLGFSIGGYGSSATDSRLSDVPNTEFAPLPGVLTYEFSSETWKNESLVPLTGSRGTSIQTSPICLDDVQNVSSGMVVIFGGSVSSATSADSSALDLVDMSNITIYDSQKNKWYFQQATGDVPKSRNSFCAVGAYAQDGSYNIYVYGGEDPAAGSYSDISILTIPGFNWFSTNIVSPPRSLNKCVAFKNQLISVGGLDSTTDWSAADQWANTIGVLDMESLVWKDSFNPNASAYDSPNIVKSWYQEGNYAKLKWNDPNVKKTFENVTVSGASSIPTATGSATSVPTRAAATAQPSSGPKSSTNTGAIAGGVVGGAAALAFVVGLAFFFLRRHRRAGAGDEDLTDPSNGTSSAKQSEQGGSQGQYWPVSTELEGAHQHPVEVGQGGQHPVELDHANEMHELHG